MPTVAEVEKDITEKREGFREWLKPRMKDGKIAMPAEEVEEFNKRNGELDKLSKDLDALREADRKAAQMFSDFAAENGFEADVKRPSFGGSPADRDILGRPKPAEQKTLGELFCEQPNRKMGMSVSFPDFDVKTLMSRSAGWAPESLRTGRVVLSAQEQPRVVDLMPRYTTGMAAIKYMEETTYTNNAAEIAEAALYPEAVLALTERSALVEKIGVWLPVTDEQLEDVEGIRDYVNDRLTLMINQRLDTQLVAGDGTTPNILGIVNKSGVLTQAKGTDPVFDAILKAMTQIRVTGKTEASAVLMHPTDWQDVRLARTADGIYLLGSPADPGPMRIFGLPVVLSTNMTQNTAVVGDFANFAALYIKRGIDIQITNAHSDFFINGKQAIRADMRASAVWFRPSAFCLVTGI